MPPAPANLHKRFFDTLPTLMCVIGMDGRFVEFNRAWEEQLGFARADLAGKSMADLVHTEDRAPFELRLRRLGEGEAQVLFEARFLCAPKGVKWLYMRIAADREQGLLYAVATDITSRKLTEDALRESEETLRKILDNAPMSMSIVNIDGTIEYINRKAVETFGYPHSDIPNMDRWWALAYPDEKYRAGVVDLWMGRVRRAFETKTEIEGAEFRVTCKDGSVKTCFIFGVIAANKVFVMFDDITRRVEAVDALRESETTLRRVLDQAPMAMAIHSRDGKVEYLNAKFAQTFGYALDEIPDKEAWAQRVAPDPGYRAELNARWSAALRQAAGNGGEIPSGEYLLTCKDGTVRNIRIFGVISSGKAIVMFDDITERSKAEQALRESEAKLNRLLEQAPVSIAIYSLDGKLKFLNRKFTQTFGYLGEDIPDAPSWMSKAYPEESYRRELDARWSALLDKALRTNGEIDGGQYKVTGKDGAVRTVYIHGVVTADKQVLCLLDDVTQRVETERALRERESLYRALIETTGTGYVVIDGRGNVADANREYVRLAGYSDLKEIMGRSVMDWTAPHDREKNAAAVARCARDGHLFNFEVDYVDRSGKLTPVELNATVVSRAGVPHILTLCRDITSRRRTEAELLALNQGLEKRVRERTAELSAANMELTMEIAQRIDAERSREKLQQELLQSQKMEVVGQLAGGIAHDFNNILVAISGYAEFLMKTLPEGAPARDDLNEIVRETERGALLTRQLTTISRRQPLELKLLSVNAAVEDACRMLRRLIGANMRLETRLDPDLRAVKADQGQLAQVILNLVINSRDAMPEGGGITLTTANEEFSGSQADAMPLAPKPGTYVTLSVADTGCGMSAETAARIFEPFFTTKAPGKGTGLGLPTVYGIVHQAQGGIGLKTEPGKGTTFKVYFPAAR